MNPNVRTLLIAVLLVFVAAMILCVSNTHKVDAAAKKGNVSSNSAQIIDNELRKSYEEMPPITVTTATFSAATTAGLKLSYNYGSTDRYQVFATWITNAGASFDLRATKNTGDSVTFTRTGASNGTIAVMTAPVGTWGK